MNFKSKYLHIGFGVALGTVLAFIDTNMPWYISGRNALKVITTPLVAILFLLLWDKYKANR
jgi:hypothetical protein